MVSPAVGKTGADGSFLATYTFPSFDKKRTDTLVITCSICAGGAQDIVKIDITMAPTLVGFFNGVWNTEKDARDGLNALQATTNQVKDNKSVKYELFYNQTGCGRAGSSCLQDLTETFAQREQELGGVLSQRWEYFWEMLFGNYTAPSSLTGSLLARLGQPALALAQLLDSIFNLMLAQIASGYAKLLSNPPTAADLGAHIVKLQTYADDDYTMVLIAHSQGNLFVNAAYEQLRSARPEAVAKGVAHCARLTHPAGRTCAGRY